MFIMKTGFDILLVVFLCEKLFADTSGSFYINFSSDLKIFTNISKMSTQKTTIFSKHSDIKISDLQDLTNNDLLAIYADILPQESFLKLSGGQGTLLRDIIFLSSPIMCQRTPETSGSWHFSQIPNYSLEINEDINLIIKDNQNVSIKNNGKNIINIYTILKINDGEKIKTYDKPRTIVNPGCSVKI